MCIYTDGDIVPVVESSPNYVTVLEHSRMSRAYVVCMSEDQTKRDRQREKLLESLGRHPTSNDLETIPWVY